MKDLTNSFSSLEKKTDQLVDRCSQQVVQIRGLEAQLAERGIELAALEQSVQRLKEENKVLKMASAVQGGEEYRTEAKRRINDLVREIDRCISMMSK